MFTRRYINTALLIPLGIMLFIDSCVYFIYGSISLRVLGLSLFPYSLLALVVVAWSRNKTPGAMRRMVYRWPMVFLVLQDIYIYAEYALEIEGASDFNGLVGLLVFVSMYVAVIAYLYVLLAEQAYISSLQKYQTHKKLILKA